MNPDTHTPHDRYSAVGSEVRKRHRQVSWTGRKAGRDASAEERERLVDEELDDTFPASDPPSWTMGGSVVSTLRH